MRKGQTKPDSNPNPAGGEPTAPAPQIDTTGLVELASKLSEYYGGGAGKGYKVEKRKGADGSMELVIAPVSGDKRTFVITYAGQPDAQGFVSGTLKIDDKTTVPVRFHPKLGKNFLSEADAKKFAEFLTTSSGGSGSGGGSGGGVTAGGGETGGGSGNAPNPPSFQFFNPFQQPALANPNPATGNTPTERTPSFWEKLSDSLASSLPLLITLLLMNSNRYEE
jgi:hypothetical protein